MELLKIGTKVKIKSLPKGQDKKLVNCKAVLVGARDVRGVGIYDAKITERKQGLTGAVITNLTSLRFETLKNPVEW